MNHVTTKTPQFYITSPQNCPYLDGKIERKLFTALYGESSQELNDVLAMQGFRRSQKILYKPLCSKCSACLSVRVRVADFKLTTSQRRVVKGNFDLLKVEKPIIATQEQYTLFKNYVNTRHSDGGMSDMDEYEFSSMIEESNIQSKIIEYRKPNSDGTTELIAVSLSDCTPGGLSMVYSFFSIADSNRSLGKFMVLDHILEAKKDNISYVYLGYWVKGSNKMKYKSDYKPVEVFYQNEWVELTEDLEASVDIDKGYDLPELSQKNSILPIIQLPRV
jgi:arginine-tRNA-protein transferase